MPISSNQFAQKKFATVIGRRMAYVEEGAGDPIVFQHGNPTSSYLWRNIMPHCEGLGRLHRLRSHRHGRSDKLAGPARIATPSSSSARSLRALGSLALGDRNVLVVHDWGSALGFDWANRHRERVKGIGYMEAIVTPVTWADWPEMRAASFRGSAPPAART